MLVNPLRVTWRECSTGYFFFFELPFSDFSAGLESAGLSAGFEAPSPDPLSFDFAAEPFPA